LQAGGIWIAIQTATGVLNLAKESLNAAVAAAQPILDTARRGLSASQSVVDGLGNCEQWLTRVAAVQTLQYAQQAANDVLQGTEFVAIAAAQALLTEAQAVANGVLTGAEAATRDVAEAGLAAARGTLTAAQAAVDSTLQALSDALAAVGDAANSIHLEGFLQLYTFSISFKASGTNLSLTIGYDMAVAGNKFSGQCTIGTKSPLADIMKCLVKGLLPALKSALPALASFL
jgi:hypothetical protein